MGGGEDAFTSRRDEEQVNVADGGWMKESKQSLFFFFNKKRSLWSVKCQAPFR